MAVEYGEPVEMVSWFRSGSIQPCRFRWRGRVYRVSRITSDWESRQGVYRRFHFMVRTSSGDVYEIHLDTENMRWVLDYGYSDP
jgi:hypothetical protein